MVNSQTTKPMAVENEQLLTVIGNSLKYDYLPQLAMNWLLPNSVVRYSQRRSIDVKGFLKIYKD